MPTRVSHNNTGVGIIFHHNRGVGRVARYSVFGMLLNGVRSRAHTQVFFNPILNSSAGGFGCWVVGVLAIWILARNQANPIQMVTPVPRRADPITQNR